MPVTVFFLGSGGKWVSFYGGCIPLDKNEAKEKDTRGSENGGNP